MEMSPSITSRALKKEKVQQGKMTKANLKFLIRIIPRGEKLGLIG